MHTYIRVGKMLRRALFPDMISAYMMKRRFTSVQIVWKERKKEHRK